MAIKKLMSLRNVPGDELEDIYGLLDQHAIDFYETKVGAFGISTPALWLREESQYPQARQLLDDYAIARAASAREAFHEQQYNGSPRTVISMLREHPLRFVVYVALISGLIYLSTVPQLLVIREVIP